VQLTARDLNDQDEGQLLQLWAFTEATLKLSRTHESPDAAKCRSRSHGAPATSGRSADWGTDRVCLTVSSKGICFELHPIGGREGLSTHKAVAAGCGLISVDTMGPQSVTLHSSADSSYDSEVRFNIDARCQACESPTLPTLFIPFYDADRCKMKVTAKSIAVHGKRAFAEVIFVWLSGTPFDRFRSELDHIRRLAEPVGVPVRMLDFAPFKVRHHVSGRVVQQLLKLLMGYVVRTDHYVIFDGKNHIIRELAPDAFVSSCNQARVAGEFRFDTLAPNPWHGAWMYASAETLGVRSELMAHPDLLVPMSITPYVMNAATVRAMHAWGHITFHGRSRAPSAEVIARLLETEGGPSFEYWDSLVDATSYLIPKLNPYPPEGSSEFTLYTMFAYFGDDLGDDSCWRTKHTIEPFVQWSASFWKDTSDDDIREMARSYVQDPASHPDWLVMGFQSRWRKEVNFGWGTLKADLYTIFRRSGILVSSGQSADSLYADLQNC